MSKFVLSIIVTLSLSIVGVAQTSSDLHYKWRLKHHRSTYDPVSGVGEKYKVKIYLDPKNEQNWIREEDLVIVMNHLFDSETFYTNDGFYFELTKVSPHKCEGQLIIYNKNGSTYKDKIKYCK